MIEQIEVHTEKNRQNYITFRKYSDKQKKNGISGSSVCNVKINHPVTIRAPEKDKLYSNYIYFKKYSKLK